MCNSSLARCLAAAAAAAAANSNQQTKPQLATEAFFMILPEIESIVETAPEEKCDEPVGTGIEFQPTHVPTAQVERLMSNERLADAHDAFDAVCRRNSERFAKLQGEPKVNLNKRPPASEPVTAFHSGRVPALSLMELGNIMMKSTGCESSHLWIALVLCARTCTISGLVPSVHSMHRLYIACLHLGIKTHCDRYLSNAYFAHLAGVSTIELNALEAKVLDATNWNVLVTSDHIAALACSPAMYFSNVVAAGHARKRDVRVGGAKSSPASTACGSSPDRGQQSQGSPFLSTSGAESPTIRLDAHALEALRSAVVASGLPSSVVSPAPSACGDEEFCAHVPHRTLRRF